MQIRQNFVYFSGQKTKIPGVKKNVGVKKITGGIMIGSGRNSFYTLKDLDFRI